MKTVEIDIIDNMHNDNEDLDTRYSPYGQKVVSIIHICFDTLFIQMKYNIKSDFL